MHRTFAAFASLAILSAAPAVLAAPVCQDKSGQMVRCQDPAAMPVGWSLPESQRLLLHPPEPVDPRQILSLICLLGGLFGLLALMPDFDGPRGAEWDKQQDDEEKPG
jgi:hypothetical protein